MPIQITCQKCGKSFTVSPSRIGRSKYCSKACAYSDPARSKNMRANALAQWANPEKAAQLREAIKERSKTEAWKSAPHFQRGAAHPRYKGNRTARENASRYQYKLWRRTVMVRDNFTCQDCHVRGGKLTVHHVKPWAKFPELRFDPDNGLALCLACHDIRHDRNARVHNSHCVICGKEKTDSRRLRCRSCGAKTRGQL